MEIKKKEIVRIVLVVLLSMVMSGITAILPIYFAVPKVIYANSVPTILVSMSLGATCRSGLYNSGERGA